MTDHEMTVEFSTQAMQSCDQMFTKRAFLVILPAVFCKAAYFYKGTMFPTMFNQKVLIMAVPNQIRLEDLEIVPWDYDVLLQDPPSTELLTLTELRNAIYFWETGTPILDVSPHTLRSYLKPNKWSEDNGYTLYFSGKPIGRALIERPLEEEDSTLAYLMLELLPEYRGRGVGQQMLPLLEAEARRSGRSTFEAWSSHQNSHEERLTSPTGHGSVPQDSNTRFMLKQGYALAQVERMSVFNYRESEQLLAPLRDRARKRAGSEYEYICWHAPTPEELIADFATMKQQMSLDAPLGDLEMPEEIWDAERVYELDAKVLNFKRVRLTGAIRHIPSGALVAYTELNNGSDLSQPSGQGDTFVLNAHRGHALGMWVKTETMIRWREQYPKSAQISTYNAEENTYMLKVNIELGFKPAAFNGGWKKQTPA